MHDFIGLLLSLLRRGLTLAVPVVLVAAVILAVSWLVCRKKGKSFSWKKAVCWLMLLGWLVITVFVTFLMRDEPGMAREWNFYPFLAWKQAWNEFSLQGWLNVFLNIALFVPLGVLLPLLFQQFRKWYWMLAAGFGGSATIELLQFLTGRGMCDVDDLFTNTLGAMLGWAAVMLILALVLRDAGWRKRAWGYLSLPLAFALAVAVLFGTYALKPYGNLPEAPVRTANLKGVQWNVTFTPEDTPAAAQVYEVGRLDKIAAEAFAAKFAKQMGIQFEDAYYYDDLIIFANHSSGDFLNLNQMDGTWEYKMGKEWTFDCKLEELTKEILCPMLEDLEIFVPEDAEFTLEQFGEHGVQAIFRTDAAHTGTQILHGNLTCRIYEEDGKAVCREIINELVAMVPCREEAIYTPAQAVERLRSGHSTYGMGLTQETQIDVTDCTLDWTVDTKGFYQPVYRLTLQLSDGSDYQDFVPALK